MKHGRLIDVDANGINLELDRYALKCIDDAPTMVELVMCKNCKCKDKYENFCWRFLREIDPSDYCSYAERRADE